MAYHVMSWRTARRTARNGGIRRVGFVALPRVDYLQTKELLTQFRTFGSREGRLGQQRLHLHFVATLPAVLALHMAQTHPFRYLMHVFSDLTHDRRDRWPEIVKRA
jgi:hypothetical protein